MDIPKVLMISVIKSIEKSFYKKGGCTENFKKGTYLRLSLYWKKSLQLRTRLVNSIENNLKFCKLKVIFESP